MILTNKLKGKNLIIKKITIEDNNVLHKLNNIGFFVGSTIKILDFNKNKKVIHIKIFNDQYVLRERDCKAIEVQEI